MQANSGNPSPGGLPVGRFEGDTYYALEIRLPSTVTSAMRTGDAASRSRAITSPVLRLMRPNSNTPVGQLCTQAEQRTHCVYSAARTGQPLPQSSLLVRQSASGAEKVSG